MNDSVIAGTSRTSDFSAKLALLVALGSETFFFGMLLAAYLYLRADQASWPLTHAPLGRLIVPGVNTIILLFSAVSAAIGQRAVQKGKPQELRSWLWVTLLLGIIFIAGQVYEFTSTGMSPSDQTFGGVFFTLMGFHALHLVAGSIVLGLVQVRTYLGDFSAKRHLAVDIGIWFWFYVVAVWVVLFSALYLM